MEWIEVTGRSIEEARELALDRLGVVEAELEYEVLDAPRTGLFGIGRVDARIRARVKPLSREKPTDRRRRRSSAGGGRSTGGRGRSESRGSSGSSSGNRESEPAGSRSGSGSSSGGGTGSGGSSSSSRRRRRGRGGGSGAGATAGTASAGGEAARQQRPESERGTRPDEQTEAQVEAETMPVPAQAERATAFAQELVRTMGFEARVEADVDEDEVLVRIDGEGLGVLVGPKGATLRALEELVRAVVQHVAGGHSARVHVDVSGYRERRRAALTAFAEKIAIEVRDTGVERSLEPMPPPDRKVVHDAVSEIDGVATGSEGEEPRRRVVIRPA